MERFPTMASVLDLLFLQTLIYHLNSDVEVNPFQISCTKKSMLLQKLMIAPLFKKTLR